MSVGPLNATPGSWKHSVEVAPAMINSDPIVISMDAIVCVLWHLPHATFPSNMAGAGDVKSGRRRVLLGQLTPLVGVINFELQSGLRAVTYIEKL